MLFKKLQINQIAKQIKYGQTEAANFIIDHWNQHNIEMYSTHNKEKYVVSERLIRTFLKKIDTWLHLQKISILIN